MNYSRFISAVCLFICIIISSCVFSEDSSLTKLNESIQQTNELLYPKDIVYFSQDFYLAIRYNDPIVAYLDTLSRLDLNKLSNDLNTQNVKLAFWINIYNSLVQSKLILDEKSFHDQGLFFKKQDLTLGGFKISLDEIEHGILRGKKSDHRVAIKFRLDELDNRIHFTMNCGAYSCPAIAYYKPETIQEELSLAENVFTQSSSSYDSNSNVLTTSELFNWFKDDFNGEKGIIDLMKRNNVVPSNVTPEIKYESYNWGLKSKNYK